MKIKIITETHIHADKPVPKGTILDVDKETAQHLFTIGAAELVDPTKKED